MNSPVHASCYADSAVQRTVPIVLQRQLARDTFLLRLDAPDIASQAFPGQFVMIRQAGVNDPLIGRPLAVFDTDGQTLDVVYLKKGKLTSRVSTLAPGQLIDIWGPLGNGFLPKSCDHLVMVAGGIGYTPFLLVALEALGQRAFGNPVRYAEPIANVSLLYGARSADLFAGIPEFEATGIDLRLATDDGSRGHHGRVTDLLQQVIAEKPAGARLRVLCCGPEPMMHAVSEIAIAAQIDCEVSLETPMACGIGICFTCVAKVRDEQGEWDYKRTCVEGPVFPAEKIVW